MRPRSTILMLATWTSSMTRCRNALIGKRTGGRPASTSTTRSTSGPAIRASRRRRSASAESTCRGSTHPSSPRRTTRRVTRLGQSSEKTVMARVRDGRDARRLPEALQQASYVVADRLRAQTQRLGDLFGRGSLAEEEQDLMLTRREPRLAAGPRLRCEISRRREDSEDADEGVTAHERHGADLHRDASPIAVEHADLVVRRLAAQPLGGDLLLHLAPRLRRDDLERVAASHIADERGHLLVRPPHAPVRVEDVCRNRDVLERVAQVGPELCEGRMQAERRFGAHLVRNDPPRGGVSQSVAGHAALVADVLQDGDLLLLVLHVGGVVRTPGPSAVAALRRAGVRPAHVREALPALGRLSSRA